MTTFKREADMLHPITTSRYKFTSPRTPWEHFYEIQTPKGVADIIFAVFDKGVVDDRKRWGVHPIQSKSAIDVLSLLTATKKKNEAGKPAPSSLSTSEVAQKTLTSASHLSQQLFPKLIEYGWVERTGRGQWQAKHLYECPATSIYAIEVKRTDWQRALSQAASHTKFTNKTFLALDSERLPKAQSALRVALEHAGVGLFAVSANELEDPLTVIANPPRKSPRNSERSVVSERLLAVRNSGGNSGFWGHVFGRIVTTSSGDDPRKSMLLLN
ncbi:hypothetical protein [Streptomyces sp. NBC_01306]|uniref:hypothetical protein n=1 Tax=Streptomyces sp. NBC_01306 TaxID=2903819 RepID=UPI002257AC01|nr:hypothetical protein [Streptomyces sp. NBC_01306]MCX4726973.1 hypothetical protein [Streptomyces sp. NBC_01306]